MDKKEKQLMIQLIEFLRGTLNADDVSPDFFQTVLIKAIDLIPEAQAGAVTVAQDDGLYHFVATSGFDLKGLSKASHSFTDNKKKAFVVNKADLDKKTAKALSKASTSKAVKSALVLPVKITGKVVAVLNLYNFEEENAFSKESLNIGEVIAVSLAIAIKQIEMVNELRDARTSIKQEIEIIAQEAAIYARSLTSRVEKLDLAKYDRKNALSKRQEQILGFLAQGKSVAQISDILDLRRQTVRNYLSGVYKTVGISTRKELLEWARDNDY
ncbi:MAG TPA: GAF domain-containing protein [Trueperaceae bacterium]|nr:GAF domain-containing protein [Trueperaceae bacterium]